MNKNKDGDRDIIANQEKKLRELQSEVEKLLKEKA